MGGESLAAERPSMVQYIQNQNDTITSTSPRLPFLSAQPLSQPSRVTLFPVYLTRYEHLPTACPTPRHVTPAHLAPRRYTHIKTLLLSKAQPEALREGAGHWGGGG